MAQISAILFSRHCHRVIVFTIVPPFLVRVSGAVAQKNGASTQHCRLLPQPPALISAPFPLLTRVPNPHLEQIQHAADDPCDQLGIRLMIFLTISCCLRSLQLSSSLPCCDSCCSSCCSWGWRHQDATQEDDGVPPAHQDIRLGL